MLPYKPPPHTDCKLTVCSGGRSWGNSRVCPITNSRYRLVRSGLWTVTSHLRYLRNLVSFRSIGLVRGSILFIFVFLFFYLYCFSIYWSRSRTLNHAVSLVVTPIVVHAVHKVFIGYLRRMNSAIFCWALFLSVYVSLAILCTFLRVAIMVLFFSSNGV